MSPAKHLARAWITALALAALTLAVYWPVRHHAFINYDDPLYVTENPHVQAGLTRPGLAWAFLNLHGEHTYWHPLTWVSHMLDCQWFGLNPGPPHLVNVAWHIANTLLLLVLLHRMTGAFWRSAMVAALFALHPLQVDTVAWITERKNVLSTCFWLLTLLAYVRYTESLMSKIQSRGTVVQSPKSKVQSPPESRVQSLKSKVERPEFGSGNAQHVSRFTLHAPRSTLFWYALALALFALGLMSKPALVTLPFVLLLLDYWPLRRFQLPRCEVQSSTFEVRRSAPPAPLPALRPSGFGFRISFSLPLLVEKAPFFALAAATAVITIVGHQEIRAEGSAGLPWRWRVANALVSYVRYLGKTFWPGRLAVFYPHPGVWPAWAVGASALLLLAVSGWVIWRARRAPYLVTGWFWFLGVLVPMIGLIQAGAQAMADRFAYVPLIGLFIMLVWAVADWAERGRSRSADLQSALRGRGLRGYGSYGLAALALIACVVLTSRQLSFWENTTTLFEHDLQVTANNSCAHFSLGNELADQGKTAAAMREWETALALEPGRADICGRIAGALGRQGDYAGAVAQYRRALQLDPEQADVLNNLAWLLATCPAASPRNGPEAVRLAQQACELTRFRRTIMVGTLAAAYAEAGRFAEAVATAQKACALAAEEGDRALLARNQELLELYRASQPYHEPAAPPGRS